MCSGINSIPHNCVHKYSADIIVARKHQSEYFLFINWIIKRIWEEISFLYSAVCVRDVQLFLDTVSSAEEKKSLYRVQNRCIFHVCVRAVMWKGLQYSVYTVRVAFWENLLEVTTAKFWKKKVKKWQKIRFGFFRIFLQVIHLDI